MINGLELRVKKKHINIYGELISDKGGKTIQWEKKSLFKI